MKLNIDCVRDVLLCLEENITMDNNNCIIPVPFKTVKAILKNKYEENDIVYAISKLLDIRYIIGHIDKTNGRYKVTGSISDITWEGHEFLNSIRPQTIWETTKENASKLSISSIRGMASLANNIINAIVTNQEIISSILSTLK